MPKPVDPRLVDHSIDEQDIARRDLQAAREAVRTATGAAGRRTPARSAVLSAAFVRALQEHPDAVADVVRTFHRPVRDDRGLLRLLADAAGLIARHVPTVGWVSVTGGLGAEPLTLASASPVASVVDQAQYALGDGPCIRSMTTGRSVSLGLEDVRRVWPQLAVAAEEAGVRWFTAAPIASDDGPASPEGTDGSVATARGAFNVYGSEAAPLPQDWAALVDVVSQFTDRALSEYVAIDSALRQATQMQQAMASRAVIEQAKGVLMVHHQVDAQEAFELLRGTSRRTNVKLRDVAAAVLDKSAGRASSTETPDGPTGHRPATAATPDGGHVDGPAGPAHEDDAGAGALDLHAVFERAPLPMLVSTAGASVIAVNAAFRELVGGSRPVVGESFLVLVDPADLPDAQRAVARVQLAGRAEVSVQVDLLRDGVERVPVDLVLARVDGDDPSDHVVVHALPRT